MMHSETDKTFKMNTHHVPFRQIVVEIRLEKESGEEVLDESYRSRRGMKDHVDKSMGNCVYNNGERES